MAVQYSCPQCGAAMSLPNPVPVMNCPKCKVPMVMSPAPAPAAPTGLRVAKVVGDGVSPSQTGVVSQTGGIRVATPVNNPAMNPMAAPAQRMEDFCLGKISKKMPETTYHPGVISAPLHELLPPMIADRLRKVFPRVKIRNYYNNAALLLGVESRTSSPVRIPRDPETLEYVSMQGVYPCGEGAGYSGGIVSSAIDGIRCAEAAANGR